MKNDTNPLVITSSRLYNFLKYLAQVVLPAAGVLYFALSQIWGLPNGEEVVGTIVAVDAFLGALLAVNTVAYNKSGAKFDGTINVFEDEETKTFQIDVNDDPYELEKKGEVIFKVRSLNSGH